MKLNHQRRATRIWGQLLLGGIGLVSVGCGEADPEFRPSSDPSSSEPTAQLGQELRGRGQRRIAPRRHQRGFPHGRRHAAPPAPPPVVPCGSANLDELLQTVNADLGELDAEDRAFARYFDLSDRARALGCGSALNGERAALSKLLNSVSGSPLLTEPLPVDADQTLYRIDLRDYSWDRGVAVNGASFDDAWEALLAQSEYAVPFVGDDADDAVADAGTGVPVLFAGAFVAAAARSPLYQALLDIPSSADDFLRLELGVDVASGESARAGFSAAAQGGERDFLAQRFNIGVRAGYVWQIADFGGNLFADPLGSASGERELAFTLPNGLLGHVLADGNGRVRNTSNVLIDALEGDGRARIATSFFASRAQGVDVSDEVRSFVLANPGNFNAAERAAILAAYPAAGDLAQLLEADRDAFVARALALINLDIEAEPEPISQSFRNFSAPVDASSAAAALFLARDELLENLNLLDPSLAPLATGTVSRDVFTAAYRSSLCIVSVVLENQVDPAACL